MTEPHREEHELRELLWASESGAAAPRDMDRIVELVSADLELRRCYIAYMRMISDMRLDESEEHLQQSLAAVLARESDSSHEDGTLPARQTSAPRTELLGRLRRAAFAGGRVQLASALSWLIMFLCAGMMAGMAVVIAVMVHGVDARVQRAEVDQTGRQSPAKASGESHGDASSPPAVNKGSQIAQSGPAVAARISKLINSRWTSARSPLKTGSELTAGEQLELAAGSTELTFACGATVTVQGPAVFRVESAKRMFLSIGCVSVRADTPVAHGFTVHTGTASLIDLGTEFHVQVAAEGHSDVYVTAGAVEVRANSGALPRLLTAGQAVHIETGNSGVLAIIEAGRDTPDFDFPTIKPPSDRDYADASQHRASIRVVQGKLDPKSGPVGLLLDGRGQSTSDAPDESVFFANNQKGRILLDLGSAVMVRAINTYSWHKYEQVPPGHPRRNSRTIQRYVLYGYEGEIPPSTSGDLAAGGWTLISRVNSDAFFALLPRVEWPAQLAVSITGKEGQIGRYRYLLWEVHPTHVDAGPASTMKSSDHNTFFGEFDVYAE